MPDCLDAQRAGLVADERVGGGDGDHGQEHQDGDRPGDAAQPDEGVVGPAGRAGRAPSDGSEQHQSGHHRVDGDGQAEHEPPEAGQAVGRRPSGIEGGRRAPVATRERDQHQRCRHQFLRVSST